MVDSVANRKHPATGTLIGRPYLFRLAEEWETLNAYEAGIAAEGQEEIFTPAFPHGHVEGVDGEEHRTMASAADHEPSPAVEPRTVEICESGVFKWTIQDVRRARAGNQDLKVSEKECQREVDILNQQL